MRLFVETHDVPSLISELVTWHPMETCDEVRLYGTKTKGLIVENSQLPTEFPINTHEFGDRKWVIADRNDLIELTPCFVREKDIKQDAEALNASLAFVFIIVLLWIIFAWS